MAEYACAFEIVRTFEAGDLLHDPDPEEVMAIFVRQVEDALATVGGVVGTVRFRRLYSTMLEGWT